ncbi:hypothetical protein [Herpetosiphon llansteffanensis]|uniref:hypothetical protein n=1 Tax=Herpetosiphon llansteffanensis TaxID=2094568 RepID=UPI000D7BD0CC|nr:hypothetical protein [Herpetosiphon llansteffanensis]
MQPQETTRRELTTPSHAAAGITLWLEHNNHGWSAFLSTPNMTIQHIGCRYYEVFVPELIQDAIGYADEVAQELNPTPAAPAAPIKPAKKKPTSQPQPPVCYCQCCSPVAGATGVTHCSVGHEYVAHNGGVLVGYFPRKSDAINKLNDLRYEILSRAFPEQPAHEFFEPFDDELTREPATSSPPAITQAPSYFVIGQLVGQLRQLYAKNKVQLNAINKAFSELSLPGWSWNGSSLTIRSRSNPSILYHIANDTCQCTAFAKGTLCWHRAAYKLLLQASTAPAYQQAA